MSIRIGKPLYLNDKGIRPRQEDAIMPEPDKADDRESFFVLCDGMGGHGHGDIAAQTVAESLYAALKSHDGIITTREISSAIDRAYEALDEAGARVGSKDIGTTMACLYVNDGIYHLAYIGDSRIYHIRPGEYDENNPEACVILRTWDHSLVNMMVKMGEITEEQARTHPDRNILVKAMQPDMGRGRSNPFFISSEASPGDYFLMCSDGVHGYIDDSDLMRIICDTNISDKEKIDRIDRMCREKSEDNYSCWLIPVIR